MTLGKRAVTVCTPSRYFFRRASVSALGKVFAECPIENTRQRDVCRHCRCNVLFAECYTRQSLCRVFFGLCRVPVAHGKVTVFGSEAMYLEMQKHLIVWNRGSIKEQKFLLSSLLEVSLPKHKTKQVYIIQTCAEN